MAMTTQLFQTWKPEIDAYIQDESDNTPKSVYEQIYDVQSTDRLQITDVTWAGFGPMVEVGEMGDAVEDNTLEGYRTNYIRRIFRKKAVFSSDLLETDQVNKVESMARDLVRAVNYSRDLQAFSMFRRAWDQTLLYGNGKAFVSGSNPLKNGAGTYTNTFSDGVQLPMTYDNAVILRNVILANLSNTGNMLNSADAGNQLTLLVGPYLAEKAFQIAEVDTKPDTTDRNGNFFVKGLKFNVLVSKFISWEAAYFAGETTVAKTSASNYWDTMWGLLDLSTCRRYLKFYEAKGYAKYDDRVNYENQSLNKYAYDKFAFGNSANYGIALSKADNTTYSN